MGQLQDNGRILYVATTGNDVTAIVGSPEYPFATIGAAFLKILDSDTLYVRNGNYSQNTTSDKAFNIFCEPGVVWNSSLRITTSTYVGSISWVFSEFNSPNTGGDGNVAIDGVNISYSKLNGDIYVCRDGSGIREVSLIENGRSQMLRSKDDQQSLVKIANYKADESVIIASYPRASDRVQTIQHVDNLNYQSNKNQSSGIFRNIDSGLSGIDNQIYQGATNLIDIPESPTVKASDQFAASGNFDFDMEINCIAFLEDNWSNGRAVFDFPNIISYGHGIYVRNLTSINSETHVKIRGKFHKGIALFVENLLNSNELVVVDLDVICDDQQCVAITGGMAATNSLILTGRIVCKSTDRSPISIRSGSYNSSIQLENLKIIGDSLLPPIATNSATPIDIVNMGSVTNSFITDPNINLIGQPLIQNSNYK